MTENTEIKPTLFLVAIAFRESRTETDVWPGQNSRKVYDLAKHEYKQQLNKAFLDLDAGQNGMLFG